VFNGGSHLRISLGERKGKCVAGAVCHTRILARLSLPRRAQTPTKLRHTKAIIIPSRLLSS
jgi:hypothetical protein